MEAVTSQLRPLLQSSSVRDGYARHCVRRHDDYGRDCCDRPTRLDLPRKTGAVVPAVGRADICILQKKNRENIKHFRR